MNFVRAAASRFLLLLDHVASSDTLASIKARAHWRRLKFLTVVATLLGLSADFLKPLVSLVPAITVLAVLCLAVGLFYFRRLNQPASENTPALRFWARAVIASSIVSVVFGTIWSAQASLTGGDNLSGRLLTLALDIQKRLGGIEEEVAGVGKGVAGIKTLMEEQAAFSALQRAQETRDYADHRQVLAIESLAAKQHSFQRANLSGIELSGINLPGANLNNTSLVGSILDQAKMPRANLENANLLFANLNRAEFSSANLANARFPLTAGDAADFSNATATRSNFSAARLKGANFQRAKLQGAVFAFADLENANFSGADLTDVFFIGAKLAGASFQGAVIKNTDVTGVESIPAAFHALPDGSVCHTPSGRSEGQSMQVLIIERIPTSRFSGGIEHNRMFERQLYMKIGDAARFPRCAPRNLPDDFDFPIYRSSRSGEILSDNFALSFSTEFLSGGNRRREFVQRIRTQLVRETTARD